MDVHTLIQALANTLVPALREQAESLLEGVNRLPDCTPCLLQIVMDEAVPVASRQAGAVYLKNCIFKYWREADPGDTDADFYSIPEQAKSIVREHIVNAIIQTPPIISRQLCVCLEQILKHDFPTKWTGIVTSVHTYLSSNNEATWLGSLQALYQLSKKYKFKKQEERLEYTAAMKTILPLLYQRMIGVLANHSQASVTFQHHILKIFYATMQYTLPLDLINDTTLPSWIIVLQTIVERPLPPEAAEVEEEDRPQLEWWKCKKWAMHILGRFYDRYASPQNIEKCYTAFSDYYLKTFNAGVIHCLLHQLEVKRQGNYVSPRVLQGIFNYFVESVEHGGSWKLLKPHFFTIFSDIVFPMMCYSKEDEQLWQDDPYEYIRMKFDIFEDLVSPLVAAQHFLTNCCAKRKNILDPVMAFCVQILGTPEDQRDPTRKDGALHVIGSVADILLKKKTYKEQLESMLVAHVFPEFQSPHGYMRARACWMLHYFSEISFASETNLQFGLQQVVNCLTGDKELPVKVEAAVALQYLIKHQTVAETCIQPFVKLIIQELLVVIRETENDDLTSVMQELIETYSDQIGDVAVSLCANLVATFNEIVDPTGQADEDSYKALTALGILSAIQSLVKATYNEVDIMAQMEGTLIDMIALVLQNGVLDFYEEMFALLDLFTTVSISPRMWQMFQVIYEAFGKDAFDYFTEMVSVLYNFIRVDIESFLSDTKHVEVIISMCKTIMSGDPGEDPQIHACKLLEVLVLQCQGRIDSYIPSIAEIALERLTRECKTPNLRTMCIQVVISILYYNPAMMLSLLEKTHVASSPEPITTQFFTQWLKDADLYGGIHDRKISVLAFCSLLQCPLRLEPVCKLAPQIVPTVIGQLTELIDSYKAVAQDEEDDDEEDIDDDEEEDEKELDSEEDGVDEEGKEYLKTLAKKASNALGASESSDEDSEGSEGDGLTLLEIDYETVVDDEDLVDEFCVFKNTLEVLSASGDQWYSLLTSGLTAEHLEKIKTLFVTADQRKAARDSRKIEEQGGYQFVVTQVPNNFVFSS